MVPGQQDCVVKCLTVFSCLVCISGTLTKVPTSVPWCHSGLDQADMRHPRPGEHVTVARLSAR